MNVELDNIFNIEYPRTLIYSNQTQAEDGIPFISSKGTNNGLVSRVRRCGSIKLFPKGLITVPLKGTVLMAFLQPNDFYCAHQIAILTPKLNLTDAEKLYYCKCIRVNSYKYNYGRQADNTLKSLLVPSYESIPPWVKDTKIYRFVDIDKPITPIVTPSLDTSSWKAFRYDEIFEIVGGYFNKKPDQSSDKTDIPFIGASKDNNGITSYHAEESIRQHLHCGKKDNNNQIEKKVFDGNCITLANDGNSVASAFYQETRFTSSHSVTILYLLERERMTKFIALFLCFLLRAEKYRWCYGRKWRPIRMSSSIIKLPVTPESKPDWEFMENYIKSLPYSSAL